MSDYRDRVASEWEADKGRIFTGLRRGGFSSRPIPPAGWRRVVIGGDAPFVRYSVGTSRRLLSLEFSPIPVVRGTALTLGRALREAERIAAASIAEYGHER